jgi:hypothetical protein
MTISLQDVLAFFGAIACIGGGLAYLIKLFKWAKKPNDIQNDLIKEHSEILKKHAELLEKDNRRLDALEEQDRLVMQALFALLAHSIDGNDVDAMKKVKEEIQQYLILK